MSKINDAPRKNNREQPATKSTSPNKRADLFNQVDHFIEEITAAWNKQVAAIIEVGKLLIRAKDELEYGQFTEMIGRRLPFGERTAQRLMKIAKHPLLSDPTLMSVLPPSWALLHRLTEFPERELQQILADGTIHADIESEEVEALLEEIRGTGLYDFERVPKALNVLIKFMLGWPDVTALAPDVMDVMVDRPKPKHRYFGKDDTTFRLDDVPELTKWLNDLHAALKQEIKRKDIEFVAGLKKNAKRKKAARWEIDAISEAMNRG